jgi:hypothetical protein
MMRTSWVPAVLALTAAACVPGRPAPPPEQWIVLREGAGQRASVNALGIRIGPDGIRTATVAVDYASVQEQQGEEYKIRYDRELVEVHFDCRTHAMRNPGGSHYLGDRLASAWNEGPEPLPWEKVVPGTFLADALTHVCQATT